MARTWWNAEGKQTWQDYGPSLQRTYAERTQMEQVKAMSFKEQRRAANFGFAIPTSAHFTGEVSPLKIIKEQLTKMGYFRNHIERCLNRPNMLTLHWNIVQSKEGY